ncbi:hypothetical protein OIU34_19110 [Pararhizobium sp. BT-229]|uniref:hypothetical protein n=1 Tax=Pararhizobium sp. BT-229 TaxID=2986923 RepID=UPI0021F724B0|nr:hypothetical protein [Pararhizobium sp. BT-229]MCV9963992.1 hypothetical protein [Pararhizobium sp. BT-229]
MTIPKKTADLELPGATLFGRASIRADLKAIRERHDQMLADDVKYSGDRIDHVIVPSRMATEIAWKRAVERRDSIRSQPDKAFGLVCIAGVLLSVAGAAYLLSGADPVVVAAVCVLALCLSSAFFATAYDYISGGASLSGISGVFSNPVTGFYPWMRDSVLLASSGAWGVGGKGLYVPRFPREEYEPYHNIIPYGEIVGVEVSTWAGNNERSYPAHLVIRISNQAAAYEFPDASTGGGLSAREVADIIEARMSESRGLVSTPG